ncbi:hypothetical protein NG799_29355, partial [Laspinema sp. D1]|nr:hypothetical protein [Laspinema sp. D2a]
FSSILHQRERLSFSRLPFRMKQPYLCAEHQPEEGNPALHWAACHACLFSPETSCERGNKFLDRSLLVTTVQEKELAFFDRKPS